MRWLEWYENFNRYECYGHFVCRSLAKFKSYDVTRCCNYLYGNNSKISSKELPWPLWAQAAELEKVDDLPALSIHNTACIQRAYRVEGDNYIYKLAARAEEGMNFERVSVTKKRGKGEQFSDDRKGDESHHEN